MRVFSTAWSRGFDGPGRRWVIYMKGCNLRCKWCANPESIASHSQMMFYPNRSINCIRACERGAVTIKNGNCDLNRSLCCVCEDKPCINKWHNKAFDLVGYDISSYDIVEQVRGFGSLLKYGGVTFGGGEPTMQLDELIETASLLRKGGVHTAIETNACCEEFERVVEEFDLVIADLKCVSDEIAVDWLGRKVCGVSENIKMAAAKSGKLIVRVPFVLGFNDSPQEIVKITGVLRDAAGLNNDLTVEVIRMHHLGMPKYKALGAICEVEDLQPPTVAASEAFVKYLRDNDINANLVSYV